MRNISVPFVKPDCWQKGLPGPLNLSWLSMLHGSALQYRLLGTAWLFRLVLPPPLVWDVPRDLCSSPAAPVRVLVS